jgi:predicted MFS family arabinose efflux permease
VKLPSSARHGNPKIDYLGSAILAAAVTCIVLFTTWGGTTYPWGSGIMIALAVAAVVLIGVLLVVERRVAEPIIPVHLFRDRTFNISTSVSFIVGVAMFGTLSFLPLFMQVVNGASATSSGLLLLPLMVGMLASSVGSGQLISRTGHYKVFPVVGTAVAAAALVLLSTMGPSTPRSTVTVYMVVLGVGLGLCMQTLVLAVQNVVKPSELGVATSSVTFFRSMGGSMGVAMFGALFNNQLADRVGTRIATGEASGFTPEVVRQMPDAARAQFVTGFADSLTTVFLWAVPLVLVAFALAWLLREVPLRATTHAVDHARELAAGSAPGTAEPEVASSFLH